MLEFDDNMIAHIQELTQEVDEKKYFSLAKKYMEEWEKDKKLNCFLVQLFNELIKYNNIERTKNLWKQIETKVKPEDFYQLVNKDALLADNIDFDLLTMIQSFLAKDKTNEIKELKEKIKDHKNKTRHRQKSKSKNENTNNVSQNNEVSHNNEKTTVKEKSKIVNEKKDDREPISVIRQSLSAFTSEVFPVLDKLQKAHEQLDEKLKNNQGKISDLEQKNKVLNQEFNDLEEKYRLLKKDIFDKDELIAKNECDIEQLRKELDAYKDANKTLQNEIEYQKNDYIDSLGQKLKMRYDDFKKYGEKASQDDLHTMLEIVFDTLQIKGIRFE